MAIATDGCNVIGRHNFLAQKLEAEIVSLVSAHCRAHLSLRPVTMLPLICIVWCAKLRKMQFRKFFTVSLLRSACPAVQDRRLAVVARMQNRWLSE